MKKHIVLTAAALLTLFLIGVSVAVQKPSRKADALPVLGTVPDFLLYDPGAQEFRRQKLEGKVFITDFIFTTCSGLCPMMTKNMVGVYNAYKNNDAVRFVSISVNPEYDSPAVLGDYAKKLNVDIKRWYFLTGAREEITRLALRGFQVGSVEDPVFHSGYLVLTDRKFQIRGYYDGTKPAQVKKLIEDTGILLKEK